MEDIQLKKSNDFEKNPLYEDIFNFYECKITPSEAHKKKMRRMLSETFPDRTYASLNEFEKIVLCLNFQQYLYQYVYNGKIPKDNEKEINEKIQSLRNKYPLLNGNYKCPELEHTSKYTVFYNQEKYSKIANDQAKVLKEQKKDYRAYMKVLKKFSHLAPPTFEEWLSENEAWMIKNDGDAPSLFQLEYWLSNNIHSPEEEFSDCPILYQIVQRQKKYEDMQQQEKANRSPYSYDNITETNRELKSEIDAHVDHVLLLTIAKILKDCRLADIDIEKIKQACAAQVYCSHDPNNSEAELNYLSITSGKLENDNAVYSTTEEAQDASNNDNAINLDTANHTLGSTYENFMYDFSNHMIDKLGFYKELENFTWLIQGVEDSSEK